MQPGSWSSNQEDRSFVEAARRTQIVEAAIETIATLGYAKASFTRIAAKAGVSPALISYHFANKRELIEQVVRAVKEDMEGTLEKRADSSGDHLAAMRALIEGYVHYCAEHPTWLIAVGQIEDAEGWGADEHENSVREFEQLLVEGQAAGEFRDFSARLMAVSMLAALETVPTELAARPDTEVNRYADELATTFALAVQRST